MDASAEARPTRRRTIGQLLRETREGFGSDLNRVATTLRIRAAYLEAIEEGRYDQLPGAVYALGFVRAYATHLGLDGEEAVRRFKLEAEGFEGQRDLTFPVPLAERSVPGGTMLLVAVILAICGYGVWYYLSASARPRPDRVAALPIELAPRAPATPRRLDDARRRGDDRAFERRRHRPRLLPAAATMSIALRPPTSRHRRRPLRSRKRRHRRRLPWRRRRPRRRRTRRHARHRACPTRPRRRRPPTSRASMASPMVAPALSCAPSRRAGSRCVTPTTCRSSRANSKPATAIACRISRVSSFTPAVPNALTATIDGQPAPNFRGGVKVNVLLDPDRLMAGTALVSAAPPSVPAVNLAPVPTPVAPTPIDVDPTTSEEPE